MCLEGYKLSESLTQNIINSQLPINEVYWIVKDIFNETEKLYINQLEKEIKEELEKNANSCNMVDG